MPICAAASRDLWSDPSDATGHRTSISGEYNLEIGATIIRGQISGRGHAPAKAG